MNRDYFNFKGEGGPLFLIYFKNIFLCIFTLGLYIPWAIVNTTQYIYSNIEFKQRRFAYTGSGKEIFKGFMMAILIIIGIGLVMYLLSLTGSKMLVQLAVLFIYIAYIVAIPYLMHLAMKYDYANTTYAGIRMGYRGDAETFIKLFLKGLFFSIISVGIYLAWFIVDMKKYITNNTRLGNVTFAFEGEGMELFLINLKGIFFSILTLGIYAFWWMKNSFNYHVEHTKVVYEGKTFALQSDVTGGKIFGIAFTNMLLIVFTLGFGIAWADVRMLRFVCENCSLENDIDVASIQQTEPNYHDAIGVATLEGITS